MLIRPAIDKDIPVISRIANEVWWPTYGGFISAEQISFMLEQMYSEDSLGQQMHREGISFLLVENEGQVVAFAGFSLTGPEERVFKLHKIYLLPANQGKGTGKKLIEHVADLARAQGGSILELNVNRANPAFGFYQKLGFEIYQTIDIPYYQFVLNDYVMRKTLREPQGITASI